MRGGGVVMDTETPGRIIGIGGVFFKSPDQARLNNWYADKLGIRAGEYGTDFKWRAHDNPAVEHMTIWSIFKQDSNYFDPSAAPFMINYIVDDLDAFLAKLSASGVEIDPKRDDHKYGRFAWICDADGNKIELWEPPRA